MQKWDSFLNFWWMVGWTAGGDIKWFKGLFSDAENLGSKKPFLSPSFSSWITVFLYLDQFSVKSTAQKFLFKNRDNYNTFFTNDKETILIQWGSEYQTSSVFKLWVKLMAYFVN